MTPQIFWSEDDAQDALVDSLSLRMVAALVAVLGDDATPDEVPFSTLMMAANLAVAQLAHAVGRLPDAEETE